MDRRACKLWGKLRRDEEGIETNRCGVRMNGMGIDPISYAEHVDMFIALSTSSPDGKRREPSFSLCFWAHRFYDIAIGHV